MDAQAPPHPCAPRVGCNRLAALKCHHYASLWLVGHRSRAGWPAAPTSPRRPLDAPAHPGRDEQARGETGRAAERRAMAERLPRSPGDTDSDRAVRQLVGCASGGWSRVTLSMAMIASDEAARDGFHEIIVRR